MNLEHRLFFRVDFDLYARLKAYCQRTGSRPSDVLRRALEEFLSLHK